MKRISMGLVLALAPFIRDTYGDAAPPPIKLNGNLEAEIDSLGRSKSGSEITVSLRLSNAGPTSIQLLLVPPQPLVTTNTGGSYSQVTGLSGLARCQFSFEVCTGINGIVRGNTPPLQSWTEIGSGTTVVANFVFHGNPTTAPLISLSATLAYRIASNKLQDDTLSDEQKRTQIRSMTLSFPPRIVQDER